MRPRLAIAVAAAALTLTAVPAAVRAQSANVLTALDVAVLVESQRPADHIALRDHFLALAVRYDGEARRQDALSRAFGGNPNRTSAFAPGAHAVRLSRQALASAATVRELAVYHERLAAGEPAVPPRDAARFHTGEGAPEPTARQARQLTGTARTPIALRAMEEYFRTLAARHRESAEAHVRMARVYRAQANDRTAGSGPAVTCDRAVTRARAAAATADARALVYRQLAGL